MYMKYKRPFYFLSALLFLITVSSCGNIKYLKSHSESTERPRKRVFDEHMLVRNKLNFVKQTYKIEEDYDNLWDELSSVIPQKPDQSIFKGFRKWVYHTNDTESIRYKYNKDSVQIISDTIFRKSNKLRQWLHTKVGNRPVIVDTNVIQETAMSMQRLLNQKAYFDAEVTYTIKYKRHKAFVDYNIKTGMPILTDSIFFHSKDTVINEILQDIKSNTVLKERIPISALNCRQEMGRLTQEMQTRGYYDFSSRYIIIKADTVNARNIPKEKAKFLGENIEQGEPRANVHLQILPYSDTTIMHPKYKICNVYITPNEYILKAHQKRKIKKDSFFVVERLIRGRTKRVRLEADELLLDDDVLLSEKIVNGRKIRWVQRNTSKVKKLSLNSRDEILPDDKLVHIILRKIVRHKDNRPVTERSKRKTYFIRDKVISDAVAVKAGGMYNTKLSEQSVRKIQELAVFRAPRIEYVPSTQCGENYLDCVVKMQPDDKQEWGGSFDLNNNNAEAYSSSIGVAGSAYYQNKNIFKGAEIFEVSLQGGLDFKVTQDTSAPDNFIGRAINLIDINAETSLYFPRFLGFKFIEKAFKMENTTTKIALGYRYLQQSSDFLISSFYAKMGYVWSRGNQHSFRWNPALVNVTLEPILDPNFSASLIANNLPLYKSLSVSYLVPSMDFTYIFRMPIPKTVGGSWYFKSYVELAGNMMYLLNKTILPNERLQFFGVDYSQYFKTDLEVRYEYRISKRHSVASRFTVGIIIPYGNSEDLEVPFIKRFSLGGPSSMRAWNIRTLGPGNIAPSGDEFQIGDFKMEFNSEYRFKINSFFSAALFVDIGNIWLLREIPTTTNFPNKAPAVGHLTDRFYEQLAIGAGAGLRVDLGFFIFRLDLGIQLRDPQGYGLRDDGTWQYWNFNPFVMAQRHKVVFAIGLPF